MARYWYAQRHLYDVCFQNDLATLYRFESAAARDAFVRECNSFEVEGGGNRRTEAVSRDEARRGFPDAFRYREQKFLDRHKLPDAGNWEWYDDVSWCWWPESEI